MDCSPPGSSVHGSLQASILEWVAIPFSRGSARPRDWNPDLILEKDSLPSEPPGKHKVVKGILALKNAYFQKKFKNCLEKEYHQIS